MRVLHVVNELLIGGGAVHICQLLRDTIALGHEGACATFQDGPVSQWMGTFGIPVFEMDSTDGSAIERAATNWQADVLHGHTCGGGAECCRVARGIGVIGGETVHSMVPGQNENADFEVAEVEALHRVRPSSTLIRWAFNPKRFEPLRTPREIRRDLGFPDRVPIIGRVGRLDGSKSPDEFVRALAGLPEFWGLMVGDGPEYHSLRELAGSLGCRDRLIMPGFRTDLGDMYQVMQSVCYPTRDESVCAAICEPLILEKPVVCYPVGGMGETILHRRTGFHAHNVSELIHWSRFLFDRPDIAEQVGKAGRRLLEQKGQLDPRQEAARHLALYQHLQDERLRK